VFDPMLLLSKL